MGNWDDSDTNRYSDSTDRYEYNDDDDDYFDDDWDSYFDNSYPGDMSGEGSLKNL